MANDQYHIPGSESPLREALNAADAVLYTPETQPEAFQLIKDIEDRTDSYRETALVAKPKVSPWLKAVKPFVLVPKSPYEKLVEKEEVIGGGLMKKAENIVSQRFWYHDNGDWFYESIDTQKNVTVIRFQTTASSIHKIFNGVEVPFAEGELEQFIELTALYEKEILQLYPIDALIQEDKDELLDAA